ncbi:MAG TPA: CarD family transcriptional regulator [Myxococcaceae bacterium]|nr:CarD family transcriptional regulator [Myxococcaceae bacterium]
MPDPSPLKLAVGERVVYPNQGVCRVVSIETKEVAGQRLNFVTLRREEDGAVVMVPESKVQSIGVRKVAGRSEAENVVAFLRSDSDRATLDWKQRARTNVERMSQGGILGLAEVVKGLAVLSELRPLPTKERELYDNARHLLVAELAAALQAAPCDAEDTFDLVLFPPGRERPKRTVEEFARPAEEGDLEAIGEDLLDLDADLEPPGEEAEAEPGEEEGEAPAAEPARAKKPAAKGHPKPKPRAKAKARTKPAPRARPAAKAKKPATKGAKKR